MSKLNAKWDNRLLVYVLEKHSLDDCNDNGGRFVAFYSSHHVVIGATLFEHRARHKVS